MAGGETRDTRGAPDSLWSTPLSVYLDLSIVEQLVSFNSYEIMLLNLKIIHNIHYSKWQLSTNLVNSKLCLKIPQTSLGKIAMISTAHGHTRGQFGNFSDNKHTHQQIRIIKL